MLEEYSLLLKSQNTSTSFQRLLQEKMGSQEVLITTICQFSKLPVIIPVRHSPINYIHCVFELEYWLEHYQLMYKKVDPTGFACPGCRKFANFKDYGIDYTFYHILQELELFQKNNPDLKLNTSQLIYKQSNKSYYVEQKITKKRFQLPGSNPILGVTRRQQGLNQELFQTESAFIADEISQTLVKLQSLIYNRIYKILKLPDYSQYTFNDLQQKIALKKSDLKQVLIKSMKLISLGRQSLQKDYVFALKKITTNNQVQSILIVYLVQYGIWYEFPLKFKGQPYVQLEQALYVKGEGSLTHNHIYMIGGRKTERGQQSDQVLQISFPKSIIQSGQEAKITELPKLPKEGYNFMGICYKQQLFVFYGQKQIANFDNAIRYELLNSQYIFRNNHWEQMKLKLVQRFDGSFFTMNHNTFDKLIVFFGGISREPDSFPNHRGPQQHLGQIFSCRDEKFIGDQQQSFKIQFLDDDPYHRSVLAYPVFSCPYYGNNQLLLSGESMKFRNTDQRQVYTFDWGNATLKMNDLFSLDPPEHILTPYKKKTIGYDIFCPVQDSEGAIAYGNFYIIHHCEVEQQFYEKNPKTVTQLLKVNLTNGLFVAIPYIDSKTSKEIADQKYEKLEDKKNQEII
ncbi:unnamed protein product [Paramecium primaurelia]|uniref:Uncharacterized protein n=1 Tax=Paramecium primaurelia TaxID=5886 RepID=A0A8S1Q704_PARPR|nr:unnamed protein product [Paramecium primaurelia]